MKIGDLYIGQSTKVVWKIIGLTDKFVWLCLDKDDNQTAIRDRNTFNLGYKPYTLPRSTQTLWIAVSEIKGSQNRISFDISSASYHTDVPTQQYYEKYYNPDRRGYKFIEWVEFKYTEKEKTND